MKYILYFLELYLRALLSFFLGTVPGSIEKCLTCPVLCVFIYKSVHFCMQLLNLHYLNETAADTNGFHQSWASCCDRVKSTVNEAKQKSANQRLVICCYHSRSFILKMYSEMAVNNI